MKEIKVFGQAEEGAITQAENCLKEAEAMLLMADNHKGYGMPVGGVVVYKNKISPAGVGFDIACGNKAVRLDIKLSDIESRLPELSEEIWNKMEFGVGRKNTTKIEHSLFSDPAWDIGFLATVPDLKTKAQAQLGTIGSGNHYVDVFVDTNESIWIGVHFGSRGLGHTIASHFMKEAGDNTNIMDETPHCLDTESEVGKDYIRSMSLAGEYAYAGRDWVCQQVAEILGGNIMEEVHNHHNFAWLEKHNGEDYWVVRKGATPAFPDQYGFVGSSMGDNSVIIRGVDSQLSKDSFYSTVHGAGRVMSRTQAAGKKRFVKEFECGQRDCDGSVPKGQWQEGDEKPKCHVCGSKTHLRKYWKQTAKGEVDFDAVKERIKNNGTILKGAGADESPEVYKKLSEVLEYHKGTVEVVETLRPLIVCMAGSDEFDPYKD